ncbi:discoidin domain-containing protein [Paenibacillus sp. UMB7766-LJ446]|uniref:discoidin domain-containing protein n=1 Tax=Paenibacillus sp. UMB7766-LJ446 TaxID=3046313 RepID=UPI00254EDB94|nr:discoidin domain-containing protein [Paenibacillus sp. UMB7766-LJ446]MDK8188847.1 discoidin domain-containing protein [Paenibacillus sp. UMB7766-LJ446]
MMATVGQRLPAPEDSWRRYDNLYSSIAYTGTWQTETLTANYNGSATYTQVSGSTVNFSFQGTKLRIMGGQYTGRTTTAQVIIDGTVRGTVNENVNSGTTQSLIFDISGLVEGVHTVQIKTVDTAIFLFDSLDIDSNGYLIGKVSTTPDAGWSRYDIVTTLDNISYTGTWNTNSTYTACWGGTLTSTSTFGKMSFWFYGTKLRIYDSSNTNRSTKNSVIIDGVSRVYSAYRASALDQVMVFEITDLSLGYHYVEISIPSSETGKILAIDSIEIDSTGEFRNPYSKILLSSGDKYYSNAPIRNLIPKMTSNTSPIGIARGSSKLSTNYWEYYAFDGLIDKETVYFYSWISSTTTGWLEYQFPIKTIVNKYSLVNGVNYASIAPKNWEFQGSDDGVNYVTLDKRENIVDWVLWEKKYFTFNNSKSYKIYRINITANNGHAQYVGLQEMEMFNVFPNLKIIEGTVDERMVIDHGLDKFDFPLYNGQVDMIQTSVALGSGKTYQHSIDLSKRRVDKITLG